MAAATRGVKPPISSTVDATAEGGDAVMTTLGKHGIPFRIAEDGTVVVDDVGKAQSVLRELRKDAIPTSEDARGMRDFFGKRKPIRPTRVEGLNPNADAIRHITAAVDEGYVYNPKPDAFDAVLNEPLAPGSLQVEDGATWMRESTNFKRPSKAAIAGADQAAAEINEILGREGITMLRAREEVLGLARSGTAQARTGLDAQGRAYYARMLDFAGEEPKGDYFERMMRMVDDASAREGVAPVGGQTAETVKRADLEGNVTNTFQTEAELQGIRETQARMPGTDVAGPADPNQIRMFEGGVTPREPIASAAEAAVPSEPLTAATAPDMAATRGAAAVGEIPRQEAGVPPETPQPPGPPTGRGQNQPLGSPDRPLYDALDAPDVTRARTQFDGNLTNKVPQKLRSALGRLKDDAVRRVVNPVIDAKRRIDARTTHWVESRIDLERAQMRVAGLEIRQVDDGYRMFADGKDIGFAEDVVERVSDEGRRAFAALTPEQQSAIETIGETNRMTNETMQYHGGQAPIDEGIEGEYFGRRALGRQYETITGEARLREGTAAGAGRSVGANRIKSRTMESIEAGMKEGVRYDNPWDARAVRLRGKLMTAEDAWIKSSLGPLAVKSPESTLGLDSVKGHPAFNNQWFEPAVAKRIQEGLDGPKGGLLRDYASKVNNVMTPLRASFDLSATFQQGMRMWLTNPKAAGEYWWTVMRSLVDDKVYDGAILKQNAAGPGIDYLTSKGLRYTGDASQGEFLMPRALLEKAGRAGPVGKGLNKTFTKTNQAFSRTLNLYRTHMANSQYARLTAAGLEGADLDEAMRQSNRGLNRMFGWTETGPTSLEQAAVFAPRYTRAAIETVVKAVTARGIEGNMARTHMGLLLAEGAATVFLLNKLRGYDTEWDPRDSNFLRLRNVAGLDVSLFGTYNTLFRAIAQTAAGSDFATYGKNRPDPGALWKFAEGKMSPAFKLLYEPFKGETYLGEPQDILGDPLGVLWEQGKSSAPFGVQTLVNEGPAAALTSSFGFSATPMSPAEKRDFSRDDVARDTFGKPYGELSGADKSRVNEDKRVAGHQAEADRNTLTRADDRSEATQARLKHSRRVDELSAALQRGELSGNDWREQYHTLQAELRGAMDVLDLGAGKDKEIDAWFALFDKAELPDGRIDWTELETLQAAYAAAHPGIEAKVDKATGTQDNEVLRQYRQARDLAKDYYAMPAYRGMSVEDSQAASAIIAASNSMVAYGYARDRDDALRKLRETDADGVRLAQTALRRGANPDRQRWRRDPKNRLFSTFYADFTQSQVA